MGLGKGTQAVLDLYTRRFEGDDREHPGGIHGIVADLLTVPDRMIVAIEAALGQKMQNIVTQTAEDARLAIEFLRKDKLGRCTLLPLDRIRPRERLSPALLNRPGVVGEAFDLVAFDPRYEGLFSHLLRGVLVVQDLSAGLAISKDARARIVTLQGDSITPEGSMSGGSRTDDLGLISRKAEIGELQERLVEGEAEHARSEKRMERQLKQRDELEGQEKETQGRQKDIEERAAMVVHQIQMEEKEVIRLKQEKVILAREQEMLHSQIEASQKIMEERKLAFERALEGMAGAADRQRMQGELEELNTHAGQLEREVRELELSYVSTRERSESSASKREMLSDKVRDLSERLERRERLVHDGVLEQERVLAAATAAQTEMEAMGGDKNVHQVRFQELRKSRLDIRAECDDLHRQAVELTEKLRKQDSEQTNLAVQEERIKVSQEGLYRRIHEEFHIDIEDQYVSRRQSDGDFFENDHDFPRLVKEFRQQIQDNESKLANLGNVNFEAVDELKGLEERSQELGTQMKDLTDSMKKLQGFVHELDTTCNQMFKETFELIQGHFVNMFKRLFSGGKGELIMEENADPMEAGVTIFAQPPGKSPRVLTQLSGGEKVLTTVAFLFSIFLAKPSPFCILDEVDAPLDENNVDRFMSTIRSFNDRTQFLIVTHNRRTMSLSDVLHGVTMQDSGVSRCITIALSELDKHEHLFENQG
ncbi:MAG: hypothetical protein HQL31_06310 [Planctomycetes bacterium]|nr:hypothetical protein [Planctomycetota bacterium]